MVKDATGEKAAVRVMTRVRPFNQREHSLSGDQYPTSVIHMSNGTTVHMVDDSGDVKDSFEFHKVFWSIPEAQKQFSSEPFSDQEAVFEETGKPAVAAALNGYHACIFAYGQTGSGKTYTMLGSDSDPGIAPRLVDHLFTELESMPKKGYTYNVGISFMEIYNEKCKDLLDDSCGSNPNTPAVGRKRRGSRRVKSVVAREDSYRGGATISPREGVGKSRSRGSSFKTSPTPANLTAPRRKTAAFDLDPQEDEYQSLRVRKSPIYGVHVEGLTRLDKESGVATAEDVKQVIKKGMEHRATAETKMNATSSRSHAVFQISIVAKNQAKGVQRYAHINLVDLAGSERVKMSGAEGDRLTEATKINLSLSTLRRVIDTLIDNSKRKKGDIKQIPPYREAMLTWVLSESLGGNSKTMMLATVSPYIGNWEDTSNTLRYALKAKAIVNTVKVNEEKTSVLVSAMMSEIGALREQMGATEQDSKAFEDLKLDLGERLDEIEHMRDGMDQHLQAVEKLNEDLKQAEMDHNRKLKETEHIVSAKPVIEEQHQAALQEVEEIAAMKQEHEEEVERRRLEALRMEERAREEMETATAMKRDVEEQGMNNHMTQEEVRHIRRKQFSQAFQLAFTKSTSSIKVAEAERSVSETTRQCAEMNHEMEVVYIERSGMLVVNEGMKDRIESVKEKSLEVQNSHAEEISETQQRISHLTEQRGNLEEECLQLSRKRRELEEFARDVESERSAQRRTFDGEQRQFVRDMDVAKKEKVAKSDLLNSLSTQKSLLEREMSLMKAESQQLRQAMDVMKMARIERVASFAAIKSENAQLSTQREKQFADVERNRLQLQKLSDELLDKEMSTRSLEEKHRDLKAIVSHKFFPSSNGQVAPRTTSPLRTSSPPREREWIGEGLHYTRTHSPPSRPFARSPVRTRSPQSTHRRRTSSPTTSNIDQSSTRHASSLFSAPSRAAGQVR
eukprot:TRINITY_DN1074_c0_g3_i1.p1 TRINITY_DN1074_c0_g3~~TRINITY_DN1074_c0_g3_i1.p1  ORF type:complete len:986 (+),score=385.38 TRINITY_DN1074_c0_g3_i1:80-2959(+)